MTAGWRCAVCGTTVDIATPLAFRCPHATPDDPHHVLRLSERDAPAATDVTDPNPYLRYGPRLAWWAFARANGMSDAECAALTTEVARGFAVTPFERSSVLSDELGSEVWVKDETGNVAGSHKARHLVGILLHLRAAEILGLLDDRPPLAIASCGNAALAAATLAAGLDWPIDVYVPTWMDAGFGERLDQLGARIHRCERRAGDPPGDPAMLRFREASWAGAIPFTVQGPENAMCLDGGRTIGWEIADQGSAAGIDLGRIMIQVGGGAFATCVGTALGASVRLDAVQTEGCAPLAAAWQRLADHADPARAWSQVMRPWPDPHSVADGILDDETYDWISVVEAMRASGGTPVVVPERVVVAAHELATEAGYHVSPTGSAGLAGLLVVRDELAPDDTVAVVMSGVAR